MRRRTVIASVAAAGAAVTAGLYRFTDLFVKHYPPTPYDDVLSRLSDRDPAIRFGAAVRGAPDAPALAARLRAELIEQGRAREEPLIAADLAGEVYFGNSLRGLIPARPV